MASLAADQRALPEPSTQAAPHAVEDGRIAAGTESQPFSAAAGPAMQSQESQAGSAAGGDVLHSQRPEEHQRGNQPLHKSLFRGALRRLAGKQSPGAQEVQVSIASPLPCEMPCTGLAASIVLAVSLAMAADGTSTIKGATRLCEPCRKRAQGALERLQPPSLLLTCT